VEQIAFQLKKTVDERAIRYLLLGDENAVFSVSEMLYDMLSLFQTTTDYSQISAELNRKHGVDYITADMVDKTIGTALAKLNKSTALKQEDYIKFKIPIIGDGKFEGAYRVLSLLFNKYVAIVLPLVSLFLTLWFFISNRLFSFSQLFATSINYLSVYNALIVYMVMIIIFICHEIGHASASWHYGVKPKEIGFGFYFVFPVFFSNVTNIWQLSKSKRNVVNCGGVYFQCIINVILIALYNYHFFRPIMFILIVTNVSSILGSLNPFFRYDGYWIFSDSFNIPNLKAEAQKANLKLLFNGPWIFFKYRSKKNSALITYALASVLFWLYVYYAVGQYCIQNSINTYTFFASAAGVKDGTALFHALFDLVFMLVILYLFTLHFIQTLKITYHAIPGVYNRKKQVV